MKKFFLLALVVCMLLQLASCATGGDKGQNETNSVKAWAYHGFEKTVVNAAPENALSADYTVYLCKGETEGCQVAIYSDTDIKNVMLTLSSGGDEAIAVSIYSMHKTHKIGKKQYTDALIPYYGMRIMVEEKVVLPFFIEFTTTADTPAGEYKYLYELKNRSGDVYATYNITVHVWDIVLPEKRSFALSAGLNKQWMGLYSNGDSSEEMYKIWHDMEIQHNINPYDVPYGILDDRANEYLSDPKRTSFMVPIPKNEDGTINEELLLKYYNKIKSNSDWLKKAYFLPLDEPRTKEHLVQLKEWYETLKRLCPEIPITAPFYTNLELEGMKDQVDQMSEYMEFWCPKLCLWDDERSYGDYLTYTPEKTFAERMAEQKASGDKLWAYVCNDPDDPYAQMFIDTEGVNQRLMFWQCYQRDVDGFLYWTTAYYGYDKKGNHVDPWVNTNTGIANGEGKAIYGCGFLFYPGRDVGVTGCVPSLRAKIVRDGCDDVELFYLAEQVLGEEWVKAKTYEATPDVTTFTTNDKFAELRIEIGNALEAATKNQ